jgi:hypothetical protein
MRYVQSFKDEYGRTGLNQSRINGGGGLKCDVDKGEDRP